MLAAIVLVGALPELGGERAARQRKRFDEQDAVLAGTVVVLGDAIDLEPERLVEGDATPRSRVT